MSDVTVISPLPVQLLDPVIEVPIDELQDRLIPIQEDELPQGVLELMAAMTLRQRPVMETGRANLLQPMVNLSQTEVVESDSSPTMTYPQAQPVFGKPVHLPLPQTVASVAPVLERVVTPASANPQPSMVVEPVLVERLSNSVESLSVQRAEMAGAASPPEFEGQKPEAPTSLAVARHAPPIAPSPVPASVVPPSPPAIDTITDTTIETLPGSDRGLLQVPFNKGAVSGQVTISRVADEPIRNLQLSPSNAQVHEQLKVSLEHLREPVWRLTDSGGEQQRQGSRQAPDDESAEDTGQEA
ncbi:MAG: invasion protein [Pseudomonas sp.]|uniref:SpaN/EivJ family type III secretion system needle length determinant n=1 Tax=Pseudomonas sp. TaxID=306 RepID=UPI003D6F8064